MPNVVWSWPDLFLIFLFFGLFATLGLWLPQLGSRFFGDEASAKEMHLVDRTQRGFRAFLLFLLALMLNDVRQKFVRMDGEVAKEAGEIQKLHRLLEVDASMEAKGERKLLREYAGLIAEDEWRTLAAPRPELSARASEVLVELRQRVRSALLSGKGVASGEVWAELNRIEDLRQLRLVNAQSSTSYLLWIVIGCMMVLECLISIGPRKTWREKVTAGGYYGSVGMVMGLILIFERPFLGETRLSSAPFEQVAQGRDK